MKYNGVCIAVADIARARKFYEELFGMEVYQDYGINVSFAGGLSLQQDFDWLVKLPKERIVSKPNNIELYFEEKDFDGFVAALQSRDDIEYLGGVAEAGWGQRSLRFYDPDGHLIEVGEHMGTVVRRFLATGMTTDEVAKRMDVSVKDLQTLLAEE